MVLRGGVVRGWVELFLAVVFIEGQLLLQDPVLEHQLLQEHLLRPVNLDLALLLQPVVVVVHVPVPLIRVVLK